MSKVNLDELRKSLEDLEFSPEEIESIISKAQEEADGGEGSEGDGGGEGSEGDDDDLEKKKCINKSQDIDILKAIKATNDLQLEKVTERLSDSFAKAIESISEKFESELGTLKKSIDEIGGTPEPRRGFSRQSILEKGGLGEDEDGKKILSVSAQKDDVIKAIEDVIEKSTDENRKGRFEKALLHYNMGGASIPQDIAQELFSKENIRLVR